MAHSVDLVAVLESRRRLAALAAEHPELCGPRGADNVDEWEATLTEDERMATQQTAIRLDKELLDRVDEHAKRMTLMMVGVNFTRADAIRALLIKALESEEQKKPARRAR